MTVTTLRQRNDVFASLAERVARYVMGSMQEGRLEVELPGGTRRVFGQPSSPEVAALRINSNEFFLRLLRGGEIAFGETYMDGLWDTDDLTAVLRLGILNRNAVPAPLKALNMVSRLPSRRLHVGRRNTKQGSKRNIAAHYDLSNEFFATFLDETMTYSSAVFDSPEMSLAEAQRRKYDLLCAKAGVSAGDRLLEIGCGWGGFAMHAAGEYGALVDAVTISQEQASLARRRIAEAGLDERIRVDLRDYRDISGTYDAIVAIEMFEAVGAEYFRTFFEKCDTLLRPGGRLVIQTISVPERSFAGLRDGVNWMQKYIFPGGMLPSLAQIDKAIAGTRLNIHHVEDIAESYVTTLQRWRANFEASLSTVRSLGFDERFIRMWRYYLCAAEAGFATRNTGDLQIVFEKSVV